MMPVVAVWSNIVIILPAMPVLRTAPLKTIQVLTEDLERRQDPAGTCCKHRHRKQLKHPEPNVRSILPVGYSWPESQE